MIAEQKKILIEYDNHQFCVANVEKYVGGDTFARKRRAKSIVAEMLNDGVIELVQSRGHNYYKVVKPLCRDYMRGVSMAKSCQYPPATASDDVRCGWWDYMDLIKPMKREA